MKKRFLGGSIALLALAAIVGFAVKNTGANIAPLAGSADSAGRELGRSRVRPGDALAVRRERGWRGWRLGRTDRRRG